MFHTNDGHPVTAVTAGQMRQVDRTALAFGLTILQMMEHAGRSLAEHALLLAHPDGEVVVLAGAGDNGGGGLCCARHLLNRGMNVSVILDRDPDTLSGAARAQLETLLKGGLSLTSPSAAPQVLARATVVVDALIGYGLKGAPRELTATLIELCNHGPAQRLSLDVPSGLDATTGERPGAVVRADRILTLALPKTGLLGTAIPVYLADLGIPPSVFKQVGVNYTPPFGGAFWIPLEATAR